jgi:hypothetical protein
MELKDSLPCSQEPSTSPYPQPDQPCPFHPILPDPSAISLSHSSLTFGRLLLMGASKLQLGFAYKIWFVYGEEVRC